MIVLLTTSLLNKVEMNSLYKKCLQNFLILIYKSLFFNEYTTYMRNTFTVHHTTYNLHGTHMLTLSKPRKTTYGLHSFSYFSVQQWIDLPDELRTVLLMILSNVCKVWIRLISFHCFVPFCVCIFFFSELDILIIKKINYLFLEDISYIG